ncbi:LOW QUALITY PROTEIN: stathmin domain-containing protein 1 [Falco biarmicus]|uniref:LOW QUALITY PROTEIN: stathmin domain-containing protein 1 n=1 Tax=Falco cherrug TaxID=345164 RepID=UPI0024788B50|nr:LOW QUALITY PROTEIN: stathmin domain-containing protein 1 [Falco cherrug]XP_055655865.1 LOW QUALITY PROTEIN: stathmin domain-containing protein 1 [Falco peregrinus]XP_056187485.1 LOW QUALITY PROTEIN: stathmin domain-containing protein 1 [Falco biarmicus]
MGCNISNRVAVTQLSSEELQKNQEAKSQTKNDSTAGTEAAPSQDGAAWPMGTSKDRAKLGCETSEGDSPNDLPERFTPQKNSNAQHTDALLTSEFISKSWSLRDTRRQKSSDILEELRMQGIIKSQSTTAKTAEVYENKGDALEKTLKKSPGRLEEIQFGNKEVGDFTVKDMKISAEVKKQVREEELNKMPQHITFFSATVHQTTGKQTEQDHPSSESQEGTYTPQPSPPDMSQGYHQRKQLQQKPQLLQDFHQV